jgi:hypothetical protein
MKFTSESTLIYIPRTGCRSGYDDSTVGVTHKHDWTVHRTEEALGDGNVIIKRGEWQLRGHNIKTLLLEKRYDCAPDEPSAHAPCTSTTFVFGCIIPP